MNTALSRPNAKAMRRRLALTAGIVCALLGCGAFFYFGQNREVESRARQSASEKAIWATAEQRGTTYAAVRSSTARCFNLPPVTGVTDDTFWKEKSTLEAVNRQQCEHEALYGNNYDRIWERQRAIDWLEFPLDIALAFLAGLSSVYLVAGAFHLVRDRWWPWIQGR